VTVPSSSVVNAYTQRRLLFAANRPLADRGRRSEPGERTSCSTARSTSSFGTKLVDEPPREPRDAGASVVEDAVRLAKASLGERV
jgi:hypothetical protein